MSVAYSFIEDSVWDKSNQRRSVLSTVRFRMYSIGKIGGNRLDVQFVSDFGLFYDPEDSQLIPQLTEACPTVDWSRFVYWKRDDLAKIDVIDPDDEETVARIVVMKRIGGDPSGETDWTNVVMGVKWR